MPRYSDGMISVQRYDRGQLRPARRMPDGRARVDAYITRTGVFGYPDGRGGVRRELRHPDDVHDRASLDSFRRVPVTNDHPDVGLVNARNARRYTVGMTGDSVQPDGEHVATELDVFDAETIDAMDRGKTQLSGGYTCDLEMQSGVDPMFGPYDARQRNIRGNHVAIVDTGRAGPTVRARMDSIGMMVDAPADQNHLTNPIAVARSANMATPEETLRSVSAQLKDAEAKRDEFQAAANTEKLRADTAEGELKIAGGKIATLQAQVSAQAAAVETEELRKERERADGLAQKVARFDDTFKSAVRARAKLERGAAVVMGASFRMDDLDERQIQTEVVRKLDSTADVSTAVADGVIAGMFNALVAGYNKTNRQIAEIGETIAAHTDSVHAAAETDRSRADEAEARRKARREQGFKPLPNSREARAARARE